MTTSTNQQVVSIVNALTDYLFSDKLDQSIVEFKKYTAVEEPVVMTMELMRAVIDKTATPEQLELVNKLTMQKLRKVSEEDSTNSLIFNIDGFRYHVKQSVNDYTVYSKYKAPDFSSLPEKFKEPIIYDVDLIHERFIELTSLYPQQSFITFNNKDRYSSNEFNEYGIARLSTYYSVAYVSKDLLELCDKFPEAFSEEQLAFIDENKKGSFQKIERSQKTLEDAFKVWKSLLRKKKATADKQFAFNDSDNYAYLEETDTHLMMSQRSQNTLYAYVFEKATGRYKVWKAARDVKADHDDFYYSEMVEDCTDYLEMAQYYIGRSYGPTTYPVMVEHDGYDKSAQYYLHHFEDDNGLVYDSARGFNLQSDDSGNLMSDFDLLLTVIHHYN